MSDSALNEATKSEGTSIEAQKPKVKYDWYQTDSFVTVNVLIKNVDKDKVKISFEELSLAINELPLEDSFNLHLSKAINPSKCSYRITPTKIELKLKKLNEDTWSGLEAAENKQEKLPQPLPKRNWDKLVETELKDDAAQGEAALNELFQKIYSEGSDEVKKAMNKSFLESGGTVLSTNWNEVGEKKVDIKPPDGMEWKKWDE